MSKLKKLDLGCGNNKQPGCIGIDRLNLKGVNIVHDLDKYPYPIKDNTFDQVVAYNCLEHINDNISLFSEVYRILKPGGTFHFEVPHFSSCDMYTDLTHKTFFSYRSIDYFIDDGNMLNSFNYCPDVKFRLLGRKITFWGAKRFIDYPQELLFNKIPLFYERKLSWVFPAHQIVFTLKSLKK